MRSLSKISKKNDANIIKTSVDTPLVYIVMAVYRPNHTFFKKQLESIKNQSHKNFICLCVSDGCHQTLFDNTKKMIDDPRFDFVNHITRIGPFNNFGRALELVPKHADYVAFSDQDDIWHETKIEHKLALALQKNADLIYSDARLIDKNDKIIHSSLFDYKDYPKSTNFNQLLIGNSISGMSMLFSQKVLKKSIPFPVQAIKPVYYHDLWVALISSKCGGVVFLDKPTLDYRQHDDNALGCGKPNKNIIVEHFKLIKLITKPRWCLTFYSYHRYITKKLLNHLKEKNIALDKRFTITLQDLSHYLKKNNVLHAHSALAYLIAQVYLSSRLTKQKARKLYKQIHSCAKKTCAT
jgi:glycosyltransferase involved in cell wall biosynthesis